MPQHRDLVPVTVYLPPDVLDQYEADARAEGLSLSAELRRVLVKIKRKR